MKKTVKKKSMNTKIVSVSDIMLQQNVFVFFKKGVDCVVWQLCAFQSDF